MPRTKKSFDRKRAVTFQLVHRSQEDPLVVDENAPQFVLKETSAEPAQGEQKYDVYFDEDYDYLRYLKNRDDNRMGWPLTNEEIEASLEDQKQRKLKLPSSVFESDVKEDVGMLNKATPVYGLQLHLDPDIVAAMDDDYDHENSESELEDNFVQLAQGVACSDDEYNNLDELDDDITSLPGSMYSDDKEETKSRFTEYSMSSSVIRRNEHLTLLDDRFEKMFESYTEQEIGALDCDEIEGHVEDNSEILLQYADEFARDQLKKKLDCNEYNKQRTMLQADTGRRKCGLDEYVQVKIENTKSWDCESILSTYTNIYNHPTVIKESKPQRIDVNPRTGIPKNVLSCGKLTASALNALNKEYEVNERSKVAARAHSVAANSVISQLSALSIRPKYESPEQRKERKHNLKEYRKERRLEKKANKIAFKNEQQRQMKVNLGNTAKILHTIA